MKVKALWGAAAFVMALAAGAAAQQPGPASGRAGNSAAFEEFREKHKYTFELIDTVRKLGEIDKDKKYALTQAQAKQVLAVLKPLRDKPKLTQAQAKQALGGVKKPLTLEQLNAMSRIKQPGRPGRGQGLAAGPRPGSGQRPGGPPPGGPPGEPGARPAQRGLDPKTMQDFNPFYSKATASDPGSAQRAKRWNEFFSSLERKANPPKAGASAGTAGKTTASKSSTKTTKK